MRVYAAICGYLEVEFDRLVAGETGFIRIPVPAYIIEHPKGLAVFDTGLKSGLSDANDPAHAKFSAYRIRVELPNGSDLASHLAAIGHPSKDVRYLINS